MVSTVNAQVTFTTIHVTCIHMHVGMHEYVTMTKHKQEHYKYTKQNTEQHEKTYTDRMHVRVRISVLQSGSFP